MAIHKIKNADCLSVNKLKINCLFIVFFQSILVRHIRHISARLFSPLVTSGHFCQTFLHRGTPGRNIVHHLPSGLQNAIFSKQVPSIRRYKAMNPVLETSVGAFCLLESIFSSSFVFVETSFLHRVSKKTLAFVREVPQEWLALLRDLFIRGYRRNQIVFHSLL